MVGPLPQSTHYIDWRRGVSSNLPSKVEPVDGARAGVPVETGVAAAELARWPQVPPHWVHLPNDVKLARTNSRPSIRPGWTMHSRQISEWGSERDAAVCWASHVRGVLSEVTS